MGPTVGTLPRRRTRTRFGLRRIVDPITLIELGSTRDAPGTFFFDGDSSDGFLWDVWWVKIRLGCLGLECRKYQLFGKQKGIAS